MCAVGKSLGRGGEGGDEQLADGHAHGSDHEQLASTPRFYDQETGQCRHHIDDLYDEGYQERIVDARSVEEGGSVVHDEIDSGKLLKHPQAASSQGPASQVRRAKDDVLVVSRPRAISYSWLASISASSSTRAGWSYVEPAQSTERQGGGVPCGRA